MNKKIYIGLLFASMLLAACGDSNATDPDDVSSSNSTANGTELDAEADYSVESYESLPVCNDRKEGQTGYVAGVSKIYVCEDGEWVVTQKSSSSSSSVSEDKPVAGESSESSGANAGGYDPSTGILTDARDGQKYKTTTIGDQVWMAENLNYAYRQPTADLDSSSFCYDNDPAMCKKYGRLYLWSAAMDSAGVLKNDGKGKGCGYFVRCDVEGPIQGVCPKGWHLPSKEEFRTLIRETGGLSEDNLRASSWEDGGDEYGFSALLAGDCYDEEFGNLGNIAFFWSSTESYENVAYYLFVAAGFKLVEPDDEDLGFSVRCLKDY